MGCNGLIRIAGGCTLIARGDKNRYSLTRGLLIGREIGSIRRTAVFRLALAIADAHNRRRAGAIKEVLQRNQTAEDRRGIRAICKLNGCTRRGGSRPLRIERGFTFSAIDAWVIAGRQTRRNYLEKCSRIA